MDTNEIMTNDEVIETTVEIVDASSGKAFKVAAGIGLAVLGGGIAYKYIVKPMLANIKAKKEQQEIDAGNEASDNVGTDEESEKTE